MKAILPLALLLYGVPFRADRCGRYVNNFFSEDHKATVGVDFAVKHVNVNGTEVRLQLWDIAGQERFGASQSKVSCLLQVQCQWVSAPALDLTLSLAAIGRLKVYYKDALGALLVYDISRPQTFDTVAKVAHFFAWHAVRTYLSFSTCMLFPTVESRN